MKRVVLVLAVLALIAGFVAYRKLGHPSFESCRSLEVRAMAVKGGSLRIVFLGVTTILFDHGETAIMTDGFFSRPGLLTSFFCKIRPDGARIDHALKRSGITKLAAVLTAHSHHDHVMDSPTVAKRTGALLIGSESTANIARGEGLEDQIRIITGAKHSHLAASRSPPLSQGIRLTVCSREISRNRCIRRQECVNTRKAAVIPS